MIDEPVSPEQGFDANTANPAEPSEATYAESRIRTRVIPFIAGLLMLGIIGLILWSMFAPESARKQSNRQVGGAIVLKNLELVDDFELEPLGGGDPVSLSDFRGKTVVINFWATWCQPCIREIPILIQANRDFGDDVVLLGLNTLDEPDEAIAMAEEFGMNYLVLDDNDRSGGAVAVEFGLVGVPETYIINAAGELVSFRRGDFQSASEIHAMVAQAQ